ncbi:MAG: nitrile hydratase subunit beta [Gammaproteobacteria bacterium]|nr:nitrile hydratase subunit beta [Gammaproteobacteria bacterium]MYF00448.1 nitrile hydratase subunit beta [Gammaproteobacteria bacterium]
MRGGHDLGGRQGFGPVDPEPDEPVFHDEWEKRVFALTLATGMLGQWNIDQSRHARERQHPVAYLEQSYYENWLAGTEKLLLEAGLISEEELQSGTVTAKSGQDLRIPDAKAARKILTSGGSAVRETENPPRFAVGNEVIVERRHTPGHTRAPDYVQGCRGLVRDHHGAHIFPDANSRGVPTARHLYSVEFSSRKLWGGDAEPFDVLIDLWEPYLAFFKGNGADGNGE